MQIVCLRHAESSNVLAGASGQVPSAPLTAAGRTQARQLTIPGITRAYVSATVRARATAAPLGVPVTSLAGLGEMGIGSREGVVDAGLRRETADVLRAWVVDGDLDRRVGDGESGREVLARMTTALDLIVDRHADRSGGRPVVVGHVGSLTVAVSVLCRVPVWGRPLPHAVPFVLRREGSRWHCDGWPG
ncbi:MAG TPA: histidine phosphatase family protein [Mycobacteriales bacterium]|nr:histidine phosphatase family protein [Mycobacteriales bacterium]